MVAQNLAEFGIMDDISKYVFLLYFSEPDLAHLYRRKSLPPLSRDHNRTPKDNVPMRWKPWIKQEKF